MISIIQQSLYCDLQYHDKLIVLLWKYCELLSNRTIKQIQQNNLLINRKP